MEIIVLVTVLLLKPFFVFLYSSVANIIKDKGDTVCKIFISSPLRVLVSRPAEIEGVERNWMIYYELTLNYNVPHESVHRGCHFNSVFELMVLIQQLEPVSLLSVESDSHTLADCYRYK